MIAALGLILVLGIVTTAATRRYIREQAGSERSLTSDRRRCMRRNHLRRKQRKMVWRRMRRSHLLKKMAHVESVGTEDRACMQAEGDVSVQSLGEQKEKRADNRAAAKGGREAERGR